ncbi:MAG: cyclic nucleotide-binding domain-containing protein [Polyangiales bacterium]
MLESPTSDHGVSALDRAHAQRLAGDHDGALQLAATLLEVTPADAGAAALVARLLLEAGRSGRVLDASRAALDRCVRRGDLGAAVVCAQLVGDAGGDKTLALTEIARAFGAGSSRVADAPALPPPIPGQATASAPPPSRDALLARAERALARFTVTGNTIPPDAPLPRLPLFGALAPAVLAKLLGVLVLREHPTARPVLRQGDEAQEACLLVRGVLNVVREEPDGRSTLLAVLGPGALFGEMALVSRAPRSASVLSVEPTQVLAAPRAELERLAAKEPVIGRELRRFCQQRMLANLVRHSPLLSAVEPAKRAALVARFSAQTFAPGEVLLRQGEEGNSLFLIASGLVEIRSVDADGDSVVVAQTGPGEVVGEISLVLRRPATADVVAVHSTVALELTWGEFHDAIKEHPGLLQRLYELATQREAETRSVVAQAALDVSDTVLL